MNYILSFFFILYTGISYSQNTATISGKVVDKSTSEVLPFSSVTLVTKTDNSFISGTVTDEKGIFVLKDLEPCNYLLNISFVGFVAFAQDILIGTLNNNYDAGKIELEPSMSQLGFRKEKLVTGIQWTLGCPKNSMMRSWRYILLPMIYSIHLLQRLQLREMNSIFTR